MEGLSWADARKELDQSGHSMDQYMSIHGGEMADEFRERIAQFYSDIITRHMVPVLEVQNNTEINSQSTTRSGSPVSRSSAYESVKLQSPKALPRSSSTDRFQFPPAPPINPHLSQNPTISSINTKLDSLRRSNSSSNIIAKQTLSRTSSMDSFISGTDDVPLAPMNSIHIVLVTHGGPIQQLLDYLTRDLSFPVRVDAPLHKGFPKNGSLYRIELSRDTSAEEEDPEWNGTIVTVNDVSHLARLRAHLKPKTKPAHLSAQVSEAVKDINVDTIIPSTQVEAISPSSRSASSEGLESMLSRLSHFTKSFAGRKVWNRPGAVRGANIPKSQKRASKDALTIQPQVIESIARPAHVEGASKPVIVDPWF